MDYAMPSTSGVVKSPPKKRKRLDLGYLSVAEKQCIINMYKQILSEDANTNTVVIVSKIFEAAGIAKSTVYRVLKEYKGTGTVTSPQHSGGRPAVLQTLDETVKNNIRRIVHGFFFENEIPTLDKISNALKNRSDLPQMSRSSLYTILKLLNFKYLKRSRKSILVERNDIINWRRKYLGTIKQYRTANKPIFYLDETWLNEGHTKQKIWVDESITSKRQAFIEGLTTGLKNPSGKGRRLIILHAGSEQGFVENALLVFEGKKSGDYHEEMNSAVFETWFSEFLTKLPEGAVIVMDNAPYHSQRVEKIPTSASKKIDMKNWLQLNNIAFEPDMVRSELLQLIREHKYQHNLYTVDEMAKKVNKTVLRLPPYHCELNPIELIWAQVKNEVATKNKSFQLSEVKILLQEALYNVSSTDWKNCVKHVIKEEEKMCKLDGIVDNLIEPLIISINNDSDTTSNSESDSSL